MRVLCPCGLEHGLFMVALSQHAQFNSPSPSTCHGRSATLRSGLSVTVSYLDDDELLVRASAVLKKQGPETWSRGRPGLLRACTNSRSVRDTSCGKIRGGKNRCWGDAMRRRRSGVLVVFFSLVDGGRDLSQYIKTRFIRAKASTFQNKIRAGLFGCNNPS